MKLLISICVVCILPSVLAQLKSKDAQDNLVDQQGNGYETKKNELQYSLIKTMNTPAVVKEKASGFSTTANRQADNIKNAYLDEALLQCGPEIKPFNDTLILLEQFFRDLATEMVKTKYIDLAAGKDCMIANMKTFLDDFATLLVQMHTQAGIAMLQLNCDKGKSAQYKGCADAIATAFHSVYLSTTVVSNIKADIFLVQDTQSSMHAVDCKLLVHRRFILRVRDNSGYTCDNLPSYAVQYNDFFVYGGCK